MEGLAVTGRIALLRGDIKGAAARLRAAGPYTGSREEAASRSMLKGLSASGWHLCAIMMRMIFDGYISRTASLGSPGVNELRWLAALRPGDDITLDVEVAEARISRSRPETGIVTFKAVARNGAGEALCEWVSPIIVRRREAVKAEQAG